MVLPFGVYESTLKVGSKEYPSITHIGVRPTVAEDQNKILVETHILNFNEEIYGQKIKVSFLRKIRDEKKFDSVEELKKQIIDDISKLTR